MQLSQSLISSIATILSDSPTQKFAGHSATCDFLFKLVETSTPYAEFIGVLFRSGGNETTKLLPYHCDCPLDYHLSQVIETLDIPTQVEEYLQVLVPELL